MAFADYYHPQAESELGVQLGHLYLQYDYRAMEEMLSRLDASTFPTGRIAFISALERNAGSASRWYDAGDALWASGDSLRADYSYRRAASLAPRDAGIFFMLADHYTTVKDPVRAVPALAAVLRLTDDNVFSGNVFNFLEIVQARQNGLLDSAIPNKTAGQGYLRYLIGLDDSSGVRDVWNLVRRRGYDDDQMTRDYTSFLLGKKQFDAAADAWTAHFSSRNADTQHPPLLFNGSFERELTASAFDWSFDRANGVSVERDPASHYDGAYSLRIAFSGNDNPDFHGLKQLVVLKPGRYRFQAQVRTDRITSDEGIRFRIQAADGSRFLPVETPALAGTNQWKSLAADFDVAPGVRALEVQLARRRSIRIDYQLTGTVWIDALTLTRLQ